MVRTKQTARGGASHRPEGMATATVIGTGKGKAGPEEQFIDAPGKTLKRTSVSAGRCRKTAKGR